MIEDPATEAMCAVCGTRFAIPAAEQRFRQERGLDLPVACPECRTRLREARNSDLVALYDRAASHFTVDTAPPRSGRSGNGHQGHRPIVVKQRYNTVCAACGAETQVPFIPRGDRPVYCRDCFNARRGR